MGECLNQQGVVINVIFSVMVFTSSSSASDHFLSDSSSYIKTSCGHTADWMLPPPPFNTPNSISFTLQSAQIKQAHFPEGSFPAVMNLFTYTCVACETVWTCGLVCKFVGEHHYVFVPPSLFVHIRGPPVWESSAGQCENIHTRAGVELTQQGVSKWAAFMLTPEAAAASPHSQTSFLLLIGKTTLVYLTPCFHMKRS